ncbi:MAG: zf-HC2 domain-containing protein [Acidobacteriia bacterium]|nr:zf-HC2 domain-containing protein [Terriglobia bacterium]
MNCRNVVERLDEFVDGTLTAAERGTVALHLESCPSCREAEAGVRALAARGAALPQAIEPAHDLWPGIAARIQAGTVTQGRFGAARHSWRHHLGALAAAAAALVVVSSVVTTLIVARRDATTASSRAGRTGLAAGVTAASLELAQARGTYEAARRQLLAALEARRSSLSPATLKVLDENVRIIDEAVRQMESALARDPGNQELPSLLVTAYRQEIDMLQRAAGLPARG